MTEAQEPLGLCSPGLCRPGPWLGRLGRNLVGRQGRAAESGPAANGRDSGESRSF